MAAVLSFLFLTISIGAVAYFLNVAAERENDVSFRESKHIVETAFSLTERDLQNWAKDYAWWDDTLEKTSGDVDIEWAEDNVGTYLQDAFGISGSFVVAPDLDTVFFSPGGDGARTDALAFLGDDGEPLLRKVQATSMETSVALSSYVDVGGEIFAVAAAPITPEHPAGDQLIQKARPVLILFKKLDAAVIGDMAQQFLLRELAISSTAPDGPSARIALKDAEGQSVAFATWRPGKPGDALFSELLPKISLVSGLLFLTALLVFFAWWRTASQANAEKSRFLAKMSHELRTPLNPIIGFSDMMSHETLGPLSKTYKGYAEDIRRCGIHLSAIIEDILDVSRIEAGEMKLNVSDLDIASLIAGLPVFSSRAPDLDLSKPEEQKIRFEIQDGLPRLRADRLRVQQVLLNLVSNALKFSDGDEVLVRAELKEGAIVIKVEDRGIGISEEDLKLLFQPFVQVGNQKIENGSHGSGLGLTVSREFMRLHGGDLVLESEPDKGTTAIMRFPASRTV